MNINALQSVLANIKAEFENAIRTATFNRERYANGQRAKEALIRSQRLIQRLHEVVKVSLQDALRHNGRAHQIYPPVGRSSPELWISGFIKSKRQDIVVLFDQDRPVPARIADGPLAGNLDRVGKVQSERSVVISVRSQLSSVGKNFDTLMERAFAETLNLRLRLPKLVMGEAYLLPVKEYDDTAMLDNRIAWKPRPVPVVKFINTFLGISGRLPTATQEDLYKYERSALILADFQDDPPTLFLSTDQLARAGIVSPSYRMDFGTLSPQNFANDIIAAHRERYPPA